MKQPVALSSSPLELAAVFRDEDYFAFLDSSRADGGQGRYSVLAWEPETVFRSKGTRAEMRVLGEWRVTSEDPVLALERLTSSWRQDDSAEPARFAGGAIGYLGYDLFRFLERYEHLQADDDLGLPDCCLAVYDMMLVFDHQTNEWSLAGATFGEKAERRLAEIQQRTARPISASASRTGAPSSNMTRLQYIAGVEKALEYIAAGDIYQVNLSLRFCQQVSASPFDLFSNLRGVSPSFYGAYLNCDDHVVISSSPELFLLREGSMIETRPIKGTRPRGRTAEEDATLEKDLIHSEKEAAELAMIVDLERNDLGRICEYGSVEVVRHRYVDRLPTLLHTVSTVRGNVRSGTGVVDILRAMFPGGSISGCPKIRAIEIIDELEPTTRHVYTGSIGFIGFNGDLRLNIAIRTMTVLGDRVYYQVGSGIVADSIPEKEYEETLQKAAAMQRAIEL